MLSLLLSATLSVGATAQAETPSVAQRLGYPPDAKLLIVHADDVGFSHSVNAATIKALESGAINSASLIATYPWFPEIAAWAKAHPEADLGIHITLTAERTLYRCGPVASRERVPSLLDEDGYFLQDWLRPEAISPREVEQEARAQIQRAYAMGVRPTHLDSHQNRLFRNGRALFDVLLRLGRELKLPVLVARNWFDESPYLEAGVRPADVVVDRVVTIEPRVRADGWAAFYEEALRNLQPGLTELVIHLAYDDEEMKAITSDRETWGSAWRQRDFDCFMSPRFRELLRAHDVRLVTWRELGKP